MDRQATYGEEFNSVPSFFRPNLQFDQCQVGNFFHPGHSAFHVFLQESVNQCRILPCATILYILQRVSVEVIVYLEIVIERLERGAISLEPRIHWTQRSRVGCDWRFLVQHVSRLQTSRVVGEGSFLGQGFFVT